MIIFSLDGVLADCEHRRHFVDPSYLDQAYWKLKRKLGGGYDAYSFKDGTQWQPDHQAYDEACDRDLPINPGLSTFSRFWVGENPKHVEIWSGRCESTKEKTFEWLCLNWFLGLFKHEEEILKSILKLRPIGDTTPEHELKEKWLMEFMNSNEWTKLVLRDRKCPIDFVFESDPKSIEMWKRRGVFVFDVNQGRK